MGLVLSLAGCGDATGDPAADGGIEELGARDLGAQDPGSPDSGSSDLGSPDLGLADTGAGPVFPDVPDVPRRGRPPALLSELGLIALDLDGTPVHHPAMVPYDLNAPLFSDFSIKDRAIYVPAGASITYRAQGVLELPIGSAILKSFSFAPDLRRPNEGRRIIETRVLIKQEVGWRAYPYLWREDQSDADYHVRGDVRTIEFVGPDGEPRASTYLVPQKNQCLECHLLEDEAGEHYQVIIGPTARSMNRDHPYPEGPMNQLAQLAWRGLLEGLPELEDVDRAYDVTSLVPTSTRSMTPEAIERATRDYLDVNCAHCHNPRGVQGITSRLFLNWDNDRSFNLGVCKEPGSAGGAANGRKYDIVPGDPEASILWYRTATEEVGDMMPLIGRSLADPVGSALIWAWIEQMDLPPCD